VSNNVTTSVKCLKNVSKHLSGKEVTPEKLVEHSSLVMHNERQVSDRFSQVLFAQREPVSS